jgi:hypothetical protein
LSIDLELHKFGLRFSYQNLSKANQIKTRFSNFVTYFFRLKKNKTGLIRAFSQPIKI